MDAATSWALGGAVALLTAVFAAGGALAGQLVGSAHRATAIVGAALGISLGLRVVAAADASPEWLWWSTPFGWLGFLHASDASRTPVFVGLTVLLTVIVVATLVLAQRDLGAGWLGSGDDTPRRAPRPVGGNLGLAARLSARPARTWGFIMVVVALTFGLLAQDFADAVADLETMITFAAAVGWVALDTTAGVVAFTFTINALLLAVFAAGQAAAIRDEEASWRIEHLLVRPLGRSRWLVVRTATSAVAVVLLALLTGVAAWLGTALVGDGISLADGLLAGLNIVPLALLALGLGVLVLGVTPRLTTAVTYGLVLAAYLLDFIGGMLELPEAVLDLSPFRHLSSVPAVDPSAGPALTMLGIGALLALIGFVAFRRRDLQEA